MPAFNTVITGSALTARRANWSAKQYCAVLPNAIVFRALVNQSVFAASFASVAYDTVSVGAIGDVRVGMTVYIGNGTDLQSAVFVGRVRKAATATTLFINETSAAIADNMTITVVDDYRVWERLPRIDTTTSAALKDWDVAFTGNPPLIGGLASAYVLPTTGTSASVAFAPTAVVTAATGTISSWLWNVGDGTITVGSTTTQNITVSFPAGNAVRWVRLTVTDSGGRATFFTFPVFCGNPDSATWSLQSVTGASVTHTLEDGVNARVQAFADVSGVLDRTLCVLFTVDSNDVTQIDMVGRFNSESVALRGDARLASVSECDFELVGFASQLAAIPLMAYPYGYNALPTAWGDVTNPSVPRGVAFALAWHTTFLNVCALTFDSALNDYAFRDLSAIENSESALESIARSLEAMDGVLEFAGNGQARIVRNPNVMTTTARDALITVVQLTTQDVLDVTASRTYPPSVGVLVTGFGDWQSAGDSVRVFNGKAPSEARGEGAGTTQANGLILRTGQTLANALSEVRQRTGDLFALANARRDVTATLYDAWWDLTPSLGYWFTFLLPASDNVRGVALNAQRFILREITHDHDNATGARVVNATFTQETRGQDAQILARLTPSAAGVSLPVVFEGQNYAGFPPSPTLNLPAGFGKLDLPPLSSKDTSFLHPVPPATADEFPPLVAGCTTLTTTFASNTNVTTPFTTTLGDPYTITVKGQSTINIGTWTHTFNFTTSNGGWAVMTDTPTVLGTWVSGTGWVAQYGLEGAYYENRARVERTGFPSTTFTSLEIEMVFARGLASISPNTAVRIGSTVVILENPTNTTPTTLTYTWTGTATGDRLDFRIFPYSGANTSAPNRGMLEVKRVTVTGVGVNPFTGTGTGAATGIDPFYWKWNVNANGLAELYPVGYGMYVDNVQIIPSQPYSPSHEYTFAFTGTGNAILFRWGDGVTPAYGDVQPTPLFITVCGTGAGS